MSQTAVSQLALLGGAAVRTKPFTEWPVFDKTEEDSLLEVFRTGKWWYGEKVRQFEEQFAAFQDAKFGISCCNGTIALELALKAIGIQAGDEVLVPAYTFIASASSVLQLRAIPVFVDINPNTSNIDLAQAEAAITPRTKAIMLVHLAGLPVDMDAALALAKKHNLQVIEDAAHSWGSKWRGKGTGAHGDIGTFSFQISKNITAAEGGIMVTDDEEVARYARSFANVGRYEGQPWYMHFQVGGNYRITEFQGAILLAQLARLEKQNEQRARCAAYLDKHLVNVPGFTLPPKDDRVTRRAYHMYNFRFDSEAFGGLSRDKFVEALNAEGIPASPGYPHPVYRNPAFQTLHVKDEAGSSGRRPWKPEVPVGVDYSKVHLPAVERYCSQEAVWFPQRMLLAEEADMQDVVDAIEKIREHQRDLILQS